MTNQERIQARIARDKERKAKKREAILAECGTFDRVITHQKLFKSLKRRRRNTEWKGSVQTFIQHGIVKIHRIFKSLRAGKINVNQRIKHLVIIERGKRRDCHAVMIDSRVIQGVVCDSCITPLTQPSLIYDNPASTKNKGVDFARRRVNRHLEKEIRKHGANFHVLVYDFHGFFDSIRHKLCRERLVKAGLDSRLQALTMYLIKMYQAQDISLIEDDAERELQMERLKNDEAKGATLGSQISQDMALVVPNDLDHMIKDEEGIEPYVRYMDDGFISGIKERLHRLMQKITEICEKLGLELNEKKTRIVKASRGFTFLKVHYSVTETGRIVKRMAKSGIIRMRRKLKKFRGLVARGEMSKDDAFNSFKSWFGNAKRIAKTYRTRKKMLNTYNTYFSQYRTGGMVA